jgi:hypothetical protein
MLRPPSTIPVGFRAKYLRLPLRDRGPTGQLENVGESSRTTVHCPSISSHTTATGIKVKAYARLCAWSTGPVRVGHLLLHSRPLWIVATDPLV